MNKEETVALVDRIWATWGIDLPQAVRRGTYGAWHRIIHDLNAEDCEKALDDLVIEDRPWPPRPGTLRRRVIDGCSGEEVPSASEAWAQLVSVEDAVMHGGDVVPLHPMVRLVARQMGVSQGRALHTNGDRELFMRRYEDAVSAHNAERYGLSQ